MSAVSPSTLTPAQLAARRRALGLSQTQLAELIRSGRVTISRWERGVEPYPEQRKAQADAALSVLEASFRVAREVAGSVGQP